MPTYNRAAQLARTLASFERLDRRHIAVELIIIDNNSTDDTARVITSCAERLPIRRLFQPKPGKNAALNLALDQPELGELVVFTDDDVTPREDWLRQIAAITDRWPDCDLFGGKTYVVWPYEPVPAWAQSPAILGWGFASNADLGDGERLYPPGRYPVGFNYWVRREAIGELRFDEHLGPRPERRILGDENKFQRDLQQTGTAIVYAGGAVVGHRVEPELVTPAGILNRAVATGRSTPHLFGLPRRQLLDRHPVMWYLLRAASLARYGARYLLSRLHPNRDARIVRRAIALRELAAGWEMLRLARRRVTASTPRRPSRTGLPAGRQPAPRRRATALAAGRDGPSPPVPPADR
jgi:hypothetical protein